MRHQRRSRVFFDLSHQCLHAFVSFFETVKQVGFVDDPCSSGIVWLVERVLDREDCIIVKVFVVCAINADNVSALIFFPVFSFIRVIKKQFLQNPDQVYILDVSDFFWIRFEFIVNIKLIGFIVAIFHSFEVDFGSGGVSAFCIVHNANVFFLDQEVQHH